MEFGAFGRALRDPDPSQTLRRSINFPAPAAVSRFRLKPNGPWLGQLFPCLLNGQAFLLTQQLVMELDIIVAIFLFDFEIWRCDYRCGKTCHLYHLTCRTTSGPCSSPCSPCMSHPMLDWRTHLASGHHGIVHEAGGKAPASSWTQGGLQSNLIFFSEVVWISFRADFSFSTEKWTLMCCPSSRSG